MGRHACLSRIDHALGVPANVGLELRLEMQRR
jgi:hypothetical protein